MDLGLVGKMAIMVGLLAADIAGSGFDDGAGLHHGNPTADATHHPQVARDQQHGNPLIRRRGEGQRRMEHYFTPGRVSISRRTLSFICCVVSRYTSAGPGETLGSERG